MKQTILISILLLFSLVSFGQNVTDSQGRKQGEWVKYYENGEIIRYKGQFKDDIPYGKFVYYYETGEVQTILDYEEEGLASAKTYFTTGTLMAKGYYLNQQKNGTWYYFSVDKLLIAKEVYLNGKLHGISYKYFPTEVGQQPIVLESINYVNGQPEGEWKRYYKDGKIQVKGKYVNGKESGECTWYSPSGKKEMVGYYKNGKKNGYWRYYDKQGEYTTHFFLQGAELEGEILEKYLEAKKKEEQNN